MMILRCLYTIRSSLNFDIAKRLVESLVLSRVYYGICLLLGAPRCVLGILRKAVNAACRFVFRLPPRTKTSSYLFKLKWLPVPARLERKVCTMVHSIRLHDKPEYLRELLIDAPQVGTRSNPAYFHPATQGAPSWSSKSFRFNAPRMYDALPEDVRSVSISTFKLRLLDHLMDKSFLSDSHELTKYAKC